MKYSTNQRRISNFVVVRAGSEYGLPMAVIEHHIFLNFSVDRKGANTPSPKEKT